MREILTFQNRFFWVMYMVVHRRADLEVPNSTPVVAIVLSSDG